MVDNQNVADDSQFLNLDFEVQELELVDDLSPELDLQVTFGDEIVRWRPAAYRSELDDKGAVQTHPVNPAWVNNLQAYALGDTQRLAPLMRTLSKEILIHGPVGVECWAVSGRVVMNNNVPVGHWTYTDDYLLMNEADCLPYKVDSDGDTAYMCFHSDQLPTTLLQETIVERPATDEVPQSELVGRRKGRPRSEYNMQVVRDWRPAPGSAHCRLKYPVTKSIPVLRYIEPHKVGPEIPWNLTPAELDAQYAEYRAERAADLTSTRLDLFARSYTPLPVGMVYTSEWTRMLWETEGMELVDRQAHFLQPRYLPEYGDSIQQPTTPLFAIMEDGVLGAVRKDLRTDFAAADYTPFAVRVQSPYSTFLTRTGRLGSLSDRALRWVWNVPDWGQHLADVSELRIGYIEPQESLDTQASAEPMDVSGQTPSRPTPTHAHDGQMIRRMLDCGLLRATPVSHACGVPAYIVTLHNARAELCALMGIKHGTTEYALSWCFVLLPVLNVETQELIDPLENMNRYSTLLTSIEQYDDGEEYEMTHKHACGIAGVDTRIKDGFGDVVRLFFEPVYSSELRHLKGGALDAQFPGYSSRMQNVLRYVIDYAGMFGVRIPAAQQPVDGDPTRLRVVPSKTNLDVCKVAVLVDFGRDAWATVTDKFEAFEAAQDTVGVRLAPAAKGTDPHLRKHALAHDADDRYPLYSRQGPKHGTNPRRACQMLSQLAQTCTPPLSMRVAVVCSQPLTQDVDAHGNPITPRAQYQTQITPSGIEKQRAPVFNPRTSTVPRTGWEQVTCPQFGGGYQVLWIAPNPRRGSDIGKLVDANGTKTVPGVSTQVWAETPADGDQPVDLLYPIEELRAKGLLDKYLADAQYVWCRTAHGQRFAAYVSDQRLLRTGVASENMTTNVHQIRVRSVASHVLAASAQRAGIDLRVQALNSDYSCALHALGRRILGLDSPEHLEGATTAQGASLEPGDFQVPPLTDL